MADFDNTELAFLQDLPAHASPKGSDLLLVNTDGMDKSMTLSKLAEFTGIIDTLYPVGIVTWFAQNKNPNTLFPGTTWKYIGENRTIRLASSTGTDVLTTGGSDTVTLVAANIPSHTHSFSATSSTYDYGTKTSSSFDYGTKTTNAPNLGSKTTSSFDYGTKTSSSAGAHQHDMPAYNVSTLSRAYLETTVLGRAGFNGTNLTTSAGAHTHTVALGAHTHTVALGTHSHSVALGAHKHTVAVGSHNHTVSGTTGATGSGSAITINPAYVKLMAWYRTA